jgi:hypothetical protein
MRILAAWEFLAGIENNVPAWSKSEDKSYPVFRDPGHTAQPAISYNKALNDIYWAYIVT